MAAPNQQDQMLLHQKTSLKLDLPKLQELCDNHIDQEYGALDELLEALDNHVENDDILSNQWVIAPGANVHIVNNFKWFKEFAKLTATEQPGVITQAPDTICAGSSSSLPIEDQHRLCNTTLNLAIGGYGDAEIWFTDTYGSLQKLVVKNAV